MPADLPEHLVRVKSTLIHAIQEKFVLGIHSCHGPSHWGRVAFHARDLAAAEGVPPDVPVLFAWLHDSCRENEMLDPRHGARAAEFAGDLHRRGILPLALDELALLQHAIEFHSDGCTRGPLVVQVCWDADRLDLGRVGIEPDPKYLCTESARNGDRIGPALIWSEGGCRPDVKREEVKVSRWRWR